MAEPNNIELALADLYERRRLLDPELDQAIRTLEKLVGVTQSDVATVDHENPDGGVVRSATPKKPTGILSDTFFGMKVPKAVVKYLGIVGQPARATGDIVSGLVAGGVKSEGKSVYAIVYNALTRLEARGEIHKVGDSWGLASWYPHISKPKKEAKEAKEAKAPKDTKEKKVVGT